MPHQLKKRQPAVSASLPEFPWDTLADAKAQASAHPDGIVDLSVGTRSTRSPR
ncbi:succinyldiaminopimelate aminotransferase domain protein [Mycobacterium intracellulare 1956]|uniref:Succinyldiaminopimelate aminotransferase domain protein n=1 Tax=Mycobacterium intracellulare 1956 TaxID=1299331 RepID=X8CPG6_MYCIT|nr:succinyldiaminopimelate aminotransferase domain protein [Mycobacterium intracellulare 1956]